MSWKFRATKKTGQDSKCAVISGGDDVLADPLSDVTRVRFHSDFHYPSIVETVTGSLTLPAIGSNTQRYNTYQLYAHGQAGHPFVTGRLLNYPSAGVMVGLEGSVPIQGDIYGFARWITLGSDETHVLLHEQAITRHVAGKGAITINYQLDISDLTVESYDASPPGGAVLKLTPERIEMGEGKFDSDKRYIRAVPEIDKDVNMVGGFTLIQGSAGSYDAMPFEYSNGDYTYRKSNYYTASGSPGVSNINFTPNSTPVKI